MTNKERLNELYKKYNLTSDDYFKHQHYTIITRSGINKIQAETGISIHYDLVYHTPDTFTAIIKAVAKMDNQSIETYGEVNPKNNRNAYPIAMAEKRAMSRAVLLLSGFYELGAFGEDESADFKRVKNEPKKLVEGSSEYDNIVFQLNDGSITMNDVLKEYEIGETVRYQLESIARG